MSQGNESALEQSETYLGDGLYASFDGFMICLRAPRVGGDDKVYLEDWNYGNFLKFAEKCWPKALSQESGEADE